MKQQDNKNNEQQERQEYVAPSVKVVEFTSQRVLCASGDSLGNYDGNSWD